MFATLLWHDVLVKWRTRASRNEHRIPALNRTIDETIDAQTEKLAIQRRFVSDIREIWGLQPRFGADAHRSDWSITYAFVQLHDFLLLRAAADVIPVTLGDWWTAFSQASQEEREQMIGEAAREGGRRRLRGLDAGRRGGRGGKRDKCCLRSL